MAEALLLETMNSSLPSLAPCLSSIICSFFSYSCPQLKFDFQEAQAYQTWNQYPTEVEITILGFKKIVVNPRHPLVKRIDFHSDLFFIPYSLDFHRPDQSIHFVPSQLDPYAFQLHGDSTYWSFHKPIRYGIRESLSQPLVGSFTFDVSRTFITHFTLNLQVFTKEFESFLESQWMDPCPQSKHLDSAHA